MFETLAIWFLIFMFYSFCGWVMEVVCSFHLHHKFINRGFLIGAVCPIYGVGAVAFSLIFYWLSNPILIFLAGFLGGAVLEYITSFLMEWLFHVRWWDYSHLPFNINGRICLQNLICFGAIAVAVHYFVTPWLYQNLIEVYPPFLITVAGILAVCFLCDILLSSWLMFGVRVTVGMVTNGDDTERISERMHDALMNQGKLHRRIIKAFPNQQPSQKPTHRRKK